MPNCFEALIADDKSPNPDNDNDNIDIDNQRENLGQRQFNTTHSILKSILPPLVFIKGVLDYMGLRNSLRDLIGPLAFHASPLLPTLKFKQTTRTTIGN
jgi:hypothetical protein